MDLFLQKNHLLRCRGCLSLLNYIIFIAKTASKKIGVLLCVSINLPYGLPSFYLVLLDKLQKWILRTIGPSLAASLEPLAHRQNVASLSLLCRYYIGRCFSELAQLVPLFILEGGLLVILICSSM